MPVVHGDARRSAFDARAGQHASARDGRTAWRREAFGRGRARSARSLPRMPRLQERVPGWRRRGAIQERVPFRLLGSPRHVAGRAASSAARRPPPHGAAASRHSRMRSPTRRIARWAAEKLTGIDRRRSLPQWTRQTLRKRTQGSGIRDRGSGESRAAVRRHVHESRRSGDRSRGDRRDECGRHHHARRTECLLRPSVDFAGPPVGRAPARRGQRSRALRRCAPRPRDRVRGTELPVGGP